MNRVKTKQYVTHFKRSNPKIREMLTLLDLKVADAAYDLVSKQVAEENGSQFDFIEKLLSIEVEGREERRIDKWIQNARFPSKPTIKSFNFKINGLEINEALIHQLETCRYIDEGRNVLFLGPPGLGKTHLAIGLGIEAIKQGKEVRFFNLYDLIEKIEKVEGLALTKLIRTLNGPQLIIIDDIGLYEPRKNTCELLYSILDHRFKNRGSIIFTSNHGPTDWATMFGAHRVGQALDRILSRNAIQLIVNGPSYRPDHDVD